MYSTQNELHQKYLDLRKHHDLELMKKIIVKDATIYRIYRQPKAGERKIQRKRDPIINLCSSEEENSEVENSELGNSDCQIISFSMNKMKLLNKTILKRKLSTENNARVLKRRRYRSDMNNQYIIPIDDCCKACWAQNKCTNRHTLPNPNNRNLYEMSNFHRSYGNQYHNQFNNSFLSTNHHQILLPNNNVTANITVDLTGTDTENVETYHSPEVQIINSDINDNRNVQMDLKLRRTQNLIPNKTATQVSSPLGKIPNNPNFHHYDSITANTNRISQYAISSEGDSLYNDYRQPHIDNSIGHNSQQYVTPYYHQPPPNFPNQRSITHKPLFNENYLNDIHSTSSNSFGPSLESGLDINTPNYFNGYHYGAESSIGAFDSSILQGEHHFPNQFSGSFPHHYDTTFQQHNFPQYSPQPRPHPEGYSVLNGGYFDGGSGEHHKKEEFPGLAGFGKKISKLISDFIEPDKDKHTKHKKKGAKYDSLFGALTGGFNDNKKINYKKIFGFGHG